VLDLNLNIKYDFIMKVKKKLFFAPIFILASTLSLPASETYPPQGWMTDFPAAVQQAQEEDKMILIDFTGSDWCGWCIRLDEEVFSKEEFQQFAEEYLIRVYVDFPNELELSTEQQAQNQALAEFFGVRGFPTVWLLSSDLKPLLQTGYREGGPQPYIESLQNDRPGSENLSEAQINQFRTELKNLVSSLGSDSTASVEK